MARSVTRPGQSGAERVDASAGSLTNISLVFAFAIEVPIDT